MSGRINPRSDKRIAQGRLLAAWQCELFTPRQEALSVDRSLTAVVYAGWQSIPIFVTA
jgi:hypothetical protein